MEYMFLPLKRYAEFSGRSRRMEYWMFWLFQVLVYFAIVILMMVFGGAALLSDNPEALFAGGAAATILGFVYIGFALAMFIPNLAVTVRRLHDIDRTGWWIVAPAVPWALILVAGGMAASAPESMAGGGVLGLVAILALLALSILLIVFMFLPGTRGPNRYGPDPKQGESEKAFA